MFRSIWFSCLHYTENSPIMRKEGYGSQVLDKLKFIIDFAVLEDLEVFCTGDLFHRKAGTSIRELNRIMGMLEHRDKLIHMILGNHDIQGYNQNLETQPIGILSKAGLVRIMEDNDYWKFDEGVYVTGENYHAGYEESDPYSLSFSRDDCMTHIHMTHGLLADRELPFQATNIKDIEISADILVNGHWHQYWDDEELGVYNIGSVARVAMEKNEINKTPKALIIEVDGTNRKVTTLDIPTETDVWVSEAKRDTLSAEQVEEFAKGIEEMDVNTDEEILEELLKDQNEEVKKLVYGYLGE